jgi:hypothetical protein
MAARDPLRHVSKEVDSLGARQKEFPAYAPGEHFLTGKSFHDWFTTPLRIPNRRVFF